uniref:NTF2 domain-containing protein n=1 Tax=Cajanus cajan TaxID=3821 RepID=A0A151U8V5_CAJCA|nr:hypothetical protein KK1_019861 [Cajanus cajan]
MDGDAYALAKGFVEHYYSTFDTNRSNLARTLQCYPSRVRRSTDPRLPQHPRQTHFPSLPTLPPLQNHREATMC